MRRSPRLVVGAVLTALALGSLATPVAAADRFVTIVDGRPGGRIDVCLNGTERKSGMRYGSRIYRGVRPGILYVKVFQQHPGNCRGTLLLKGQVDLVGDDDVTLVITKKDPKLVRFDNDQGVDAFQTDFYVRHAADLGPAVLGWIVRGVDLLEPSAPTPFTKGDQYFFEWLNVEVRVLAQHPQGGTFETSPWISTPLINSLGDTYADTHVEFILVGTNGKNARFVSFQRPAPTP